MQATLANSGFEFAQRPRLVCGAGVVERVGELAQELGGRRALLVTDPGIVQAGHAARVLSAFDASGISVVPSDRAREIPGGGGVGACLKVARSGGVDLIVGLG